MHKLAEQSLNLLFSPHVLVTSGGYFVEQDLKARTILAITFKDLFQNNELTIAHCMSCLCHAAIWHVCTPNANTGGHCTAKTQACLFVGNDFVRTPNGHVCSIAVYLLPSSGSVTKL